MVGAGSAGLSAATFGRAMGLRVALAESHRIGGDCTWTGCVPSKALLHAAEIAHAMRQAPKIGMPAQPVRADMRAVMAEVHAARERVYAQETPEQLRAKGIDAYIGPTTFADPHTLQVGPTTLAARRFLICTGASPRVPPIAGLQNVPYLTNHSIFELQSLPERLCVLGGGPAGVELAQAFQRLGSHVTLVGRNPRLLPQADAEASDLVARALAAEGVQLHLGTAVERVERCADNAILVSAREVEVECDQLLVALGRAANADGLGLDKAGVAYDERRITVNARLQTTQPHIYAAGDVVGSFQFTHYAGWQAVMALLNIYLPGSRDGILGSVPWAIFTSPEVAQVGFTEAEANANHEPCRVVRFPLERNDRAQTADEQHGLMKIVLRPNGTILGATIVGSSAGELINEITVAMDNKLKLDRLTRSIHAYPTYGFALQLASADVFMESLGRGAKKQVLGFLTRMKR